MSDQGATLIEKRKKFKRWALFFFLFQDAVAAHEPKTLGEFEVLLDKVWWEIPQDHIRNLYHSMPTRLRTVLAADGQMTIISKY